VYFTEVLGLYLGRVFADGAIGDRRAAVLVPGICEAGECEGD
jgi:hypothetical protein